MPQPIGRTLGLSLPRRLIDDLMRYSRRVPSVPMERHMHLAAVVAARQALARRPSWCAIFTKAYGHVAARWPELRRAYIPFPVPHLYEHPINVAAVAVERRVDDELAVLFAHTRSPEAQSLATLDDFLQRCKEAPIARIGMYRRALRITRLPRVLRRLLWWYGLDTSGPRRVRHAGTFGVSVTAGHGAAALQLVSPLTTTLHYGIFDADGTLPVRLTFDHRVLDGAIVARTLGDLEDVLRNEILSELRDLRSSQYVA